MKTNFHNKNFAQLANGLFTIGFGLASHWLRKSRQFCKPITERGF